MREVHDRILAAAMERFAAQGVESVKVDDICAAADIAHSDSLQSWRDFTTHGRFRTRIFPGAHFYFSPGAEALANEIIADLRASVGVHAEGAESQR